MDSKRMPISSWVIIAMVCAIALLLMWMIAMGDIPFAMGAFVIGALWFVAYAEYRTTYN